jgi:GntR family transcriptional regulator
MMGGASGDASVQRVVNRDLPVPLHEQVAALLRARIDSGELTGRVPSIVTLSQEYEVSVKTAEHALHTLRDAGIIVVVKGRGYFIAP